MPKPLITLATLLTLGLTAAQGLPDPFLQEVPPPPAPTEGDPAVQEEFLPPPGVQGMALRPYPLAPMVLSFPSDAPLADYDPVPGLNLELTIAAPRPEPEPEPLIVVEGAPQPTPTQASEEEQRAQRLNELLAAAPRAELPATQPLQSQAVARGERVPDFTLLALVTGTRPLAVIDVNGATHRLTVGDTLPASNYLIEEIHPLKLVVSGAGNTITIPLE